VVSPLLALQTTYPYLFLKSNAVVNIGLYLVSLHVHDMQLGYATVAPSLPTSVCMPMSLSMMQSRHHATAVAAVDSPPAYMMLEHPGIAWNQPAMPSSVVRAPILA